MTKPHLHTWVQRQHRLVVCEGSRLPATHKDNGARERGIETRGTVTSQPTSICNQSWATANHHTTYLPRLSRAEARRRSAFRDAGCTQSAGRSTKKDVTSHAVMGT